MLLQWTVGQRNRLTVFVFQLAYFQGDSEASETSNVLELMKMYREELRQVSILLNLTIIIGLYYIFGVLFVGFTQFKFK